MLHKPLAFPAKPVISAEAQDLISRLLVKDPAARLGSRAGAEEIKRHPWFNDLNWALLRQQTPPYVPRRAAAAAAAAAQGAVDDNGSAAHNNAEHTAAADGVVPAVGGSDSTFDNY